MGGFDKVIIIMYGLIAAFFVYRIFKQQSDKKHLEGEVRAFKRPISSIEWILFVILIGIGGVNLYQGYQTSNTTSMATAAVMIVLAFVFMVYTNQKLYVAENGMLISSGFITYKELRKWGFDTNLGDLVMAVKKDNTTNRESVKVKKDDIEEVNTLIRRYKLGK